MLSYPQGGRVELVGDRVVDMVAVTVGAAVADEKPVPKDMEEEQPEEEAKPIAAKTTTVKGVVTTPEKPANSAQPTVHNESEEPKDQRELPAERERTGLVLQLLVTAVIRIGVVMLVLKMAFKWADVHADWGQMFLPALADTIVRSVFEIVGVMILKVNDWFYADEAIAYFVLLYVLMKTTHACTLLRAVSVAGAAKLMSIIVGSLITVFVLHMLS